MSGKSDFNEGELERTRPLSGEEWLLNPYIEQDKARKLTQEQQQKAHSGAVARENLTAAQQSAKATRWAVWAALAAAVGAIGQLIVAVIK